VAESSWWPICAAPLLSLSVVNYCCDAFMYSGGYHDRLVIIQNPVSVEGGGVIYEVQILFVLFVSTAHSHLSWKSWKCRVV